MMDARGCPKVLTDKQIEWAYRKWCEGYTQTEIAKALYVCTSTICRCIAGRDRVREELKYTEDEET